MPPSSGYLFRAQKPFVIFGALYLTFIAALTIPYLQRNLLYLNAVTWPLWVKYDIPEKYGFEPGKTRVVTIETPSAINLGAWFTFAEPFYQNLDQHSQKTTGDVYTQALQTYPTILYFHGNAGSRAAGFRVWLQRTFSNSLDCNVLTIDYRGFGDSPGSPTQGGLIEDATSSWGWLLRHGATPKNIVILGQSLGTAVSVQLAATLAQQAGEQPRAVALFGTFTSLGKLLESYHMFGWIPLVGPLTTIPFAMDLVRKALVDKWDTRSAITHVRAPILLFHAADDWDIPSAQSFELFNHLLSPLLPAIEMESGAPSQKSIDDRLAKRNALVSTIDIERVGTMHKFEKHGQPIAYIETNWGGHNAIAGYGGAIQILRRELSL